MPGVNRVSTKFALAEHIITNMDFLAGQVKSEIVT
jgi:hypothetical protein